MTSENHHSGLRLQLTAIACKQMGCSIVAGENAFLREAISGLSARDIDGGPKFGIGGITPWAIHRHPLNPKYGAAWQAAVDSASRKNVFPVDKAGPDAKLEL